ncbi:MAG: hypothetical protein CMO01_05835 [Thalassobius sp.]|nr:hypothetical protein [Thalassovita sp.]
MWKIPLLVLLSIYSINDTVILNRYSITSESAVKYFVMRGEVVDSKSGEPIENADVIIGNLQKTFSTTIVTDENGSFRLDLPGEEVYTIYAIKKRYFNSEIHHFSTIGKSSDEIVKITVPLIKAELNEHYLLNFIEFEVNSSNLKVKRGKGNLDELITFLRDNQDIIIEIGVHTDSRGDDDYNLDLSEKRAKAVAEYIYENGINKNRVKYKGYGETKLLNECKNDIFCSTEKHLENRRIEFRIMALKSE